MELVAGGELFDYIVDNRSIKEQEAACIIAQVCKAVEYMHKEGTVHRDLKPENLLFKDLDHKVIKIADFGESKCFKQGLLRTYCGTPDYMAPEIIKGEPYGPEVDLWAIGVITYVMLVGFPPFDGANDIEVFASILATRYDFPSPEWDHISLSAKKFIQSTITENPQHRLTASDCLQHPWIIDNVPLELRTNTPTEAPPKMSKTITIDIFLPPLDLQRPKQQLKEIIGGMCKRESYNFAISELKVILTVLDSTTGKMPLKDVEKAIYQTYHRRLQELQLLRKRCIKKSRK